MHGTVRTFGLNPDVNSRILTFYRRGSVLLQVRYLKLLDRIVLAINHLALVQETIAV